MLSRVAERVYWFARYLERIESTARMVSIYDKLLFDLPRSVNLGWYSLITINSLEKQFNEQYTNRDERNIVKFMIGDENNPSSIVTSLYSIRENVRTTRDVVAEETWELTNELSIYVHENMQRGINRSKRHEFLENIIKGCQQITGLLYTSMPQDPAWIFMQLGFSLERADMTSRHLDAGVATMLDIANDESAVNARQIIWGNVLRSLNAEQPYRRKIRQRVSASLVVQYLLEDEELPRSITHCANAMIQASKHLPNNKSVTNNLVDLQHSIADDMDYDRLNGSFRDYLNSLQIELAETHDLIRETWFPNDL